MRIFKLILPAALVATAFVTGCKKTEYKVGDIVFIDGSTIAYSQELKLTNEQKQKAIAVIYKVGETKAYGVGIAHSKEKLAWCYDRAKAFGKDIIGIQCGADGDAGNLTFYGDANGADNLAMIKFALGSDDDTEELKNYPAFEFAENYRNRDASHVKGTAFEGGWYLPTLAELFDIWKEKATVDAASSLCGGSTFGNGSYWSSSQSAYFKFDSSAAPSKNRIANLLDFEEGDWYHSSVKADDGAFYVNNVCCIRAFAIKKDMAKVKKGKNYKVGDIVFNDGTSISYNQELTLTYEQLKKAIAVIYKTQGSKSYGVGLVHKEPGLAWCLPSAKANDVKIDSILCEPSEENGNYTFSGDTDGSDNLAQIKEALGSDDDTGTLSNYPAFEFAVNYKNQSGSRVSGTPYEEGWYLPTVAELFEIWKEKETVAKASFLCGGPYSLNGVYWSSSQSNERDWSTYVISLHDGECIRSLKDDGLGLSLRDPNIKYTPLTNTCCIRVF